MSENTSPRSPVTMLILLALHAVCGVAILWLLLKLVPQYEKIFRDFNAELPDLTIMVIRLSAFFGWYWYLLVPLLAMGDYAILLALHVTRRPRLMMTWGVLVWLAEMLLIGLTMTTLFVTLNALVVRMS